VVVQLLTRVSAFCPLFLDTAVDMLLVLHVGFNLDDGIFFCLSLRIDHHFFAVRLYIFLLAALALHVSLKLVGQLFDLPLIHRENVLEFDEQFYLLKFFVQTVDHTPKNVNSAADFGINQLFINSASVPISLLIVVSSVSLTHLVLVFFVCLFTLFGLNKLVVNVLELGQASNRVLFILTGALFLEGVI